MFFGFFEECGVEYDNSIDILLIYINLFIGIKVKEEKCYFVDFGV